MQILNLGKRLTLGLQALIIMFSFGTATIAAVSPVTAGVAMAACDTDISNSATPLSDGADCSKAKGTRSDLFGSGGIFQTIANTLIFLVGAIAVLFLIIGGLRYVISNGDSKAVEGAKNTILYAIIGIIIAIISFAAVSFVIKTFATTNGS